jgi:hypothetical protein
MIMRSMVKSRMGRFECVWKRLSFPFAASFCSVAFIINYVYFINEPIIHCTITSSTSICYVRCHLSSTIAQAIVGVEHLMQKSEREQLQILRRKESQGAHRQSAFAFFPYHTCFILKNVTRLTARDFN